MDPAKTSLLRIVDNLTAFWHGESPADGRPGTGVWPRLLPALLLALGAFTAAGVGGSPAIGGEGGWESWDDGGAEAEEEPDGPLAPLADSAPGMNLEREAETLYRRGEHLSAQYAYCDAFEAAARAAVDAPEERRGLFWARAEFNLERAFVLSQQTLEFQSVTDAIAAVEALESVDPVLAARMRWMAARYACQRGATEDAVAATGALGLLREWLILGPFDNERGRRFGVALPPEDWPYGLEQVHAGLKGEARWRPVRSVDPLAFADLGAFLRPNDECLAYALCAVEVKEAGPAVLRLGSSDMIAAWVNGREVHRFNGRRDAAFDQDAASCTLRAGWNLLFLKIGDAKGPWGFHARFTRPDGSPLPLQDRTADPRQVAAAIASLTGGDAPAGAGAPSAGGDGLRSGALQAFARALALEPELARTNYYLGWLLRRRGTLGVADRKDLEYLVRAIRGGDDDPAYCIAFADAATDHLAHEADRDENPRRMALERAIDRGRMENTAEVEARVRLAEYYLYSMRNFRHARELAEEAALANPLALPAKLALFDVYKALEWEALAARTLARIARQHPDARPVLLRAGADALARGANRRAAEFYRRLNEFDITDATGQDGRIEALLRLGQAEPLIDVLKSFLAATPYRRVLRERLVEAYLRARNLQAALAAAEAALRIAPEDAEMLALKGRVLDRLDRRQEAIAVWNEALRLQPTLVGLQRRLAHLQGEAETLGTRIEDLRQFVAAHRDHPVRRGDSRLYLLNERANRIHPDGTSSRLTHHIVKVLDDDAARELASTWIGYDEETETLALVTARVLRADGSIDVPQVNDFSVPGYSPRKHLSFAPLEKGDVIEVAYRIDEFKKGFFGDYFGDAFYFRQDYPAVRARYMLVTPKGREVYLHRVGDVPDPVVEALDGEGGTRRVWEMRNLDAIEIEPYMPPLRELTPQVQVSTFASWDEMAIWYWHLVKDQFDITPEIRAQVHELTAGQDSPVEKMDAVYRWVVNNVQNVAWEFGVHGYKNYKVSTVFQRRFGDCKDKAALLQVMARELGLRAWPVILRATEEEGPQVGRGREDLSLALLNHFNHAIAAVEIEGKIYYLDGTTQHRTLDGIPAMDAGAHSVIVRPDGAELVEIPAPKATDHLWRAEGDLRIQANGMAALNEAVTTSGIGAMYLRFYFAEPGRRHGVLNAVTSRRYGPVTINNVDYEETGEPVASRVTLRTRLKIHEQARRVGETLRFRLPIEWLRSEQDDKPFPARLGRFAESSVRAHDVVLHKPFALERRLRVHLPEGYVLANPPENVELRRPFGFLEATYSLQGNVLTVSRSVHLTSTRIARDDYDAFRRFCHRADALDAYEYVLEKQP